MASKTKRVIPGTTLFDGDMARKGYALNKMCFSFNSEENRQEFLKDPAAYCDKFGLNEQQKKAVISLQVLDMLDAGGNAYFIAKLGGIYKLDMQDVGAQQTGVTKAEFQAKLVAAGRE
ncbi:Protocatechuate 4 5-dioxygenase alpha chain [Paramagnetospirillum magnetotacticum MS-1]|uniref:Protocatechuate 4 5-dioxygenase alpha chain n=1 Tax=Paramagnetospirillum magnetotacticum MS-1 TaxID=272627 RepID=A0A0C2U9F3_PARME|nr:protocatechuate 4,5-dioxygenase subunit alpha [Paramagnetospirillum magnetotacticum]KIL98102.1 Protocatechuate 4 5-dioxygenase alpha chain [Paramagnetospirillum magnetotacticum MS-1]